MAGILASDFFEAVRKNEDEEKRTSYTCPHCGKDIRKTPDKKEP